MILTRIKNVSRGFYFWFSLETFTNHIGFISKAGVFWSKAGVFWWKAGVFWRFLRHEFISCWEIQESRPEWAGKSIKDLGPILEYKLTKKRSKKRKDGFFKPFCQKLWQEKGQWHLFFLWHKVCWIFGVRLENVHKWNLNNNNKKYI